MAQVVLVGGGVADLDATQAVVAALGPRPRGPGWRRVAAETVQLSRTREDAQSQVPGRAYTAVVDRPVHRSMAHVRGLAGRTPYRVVSVDQRGRVTVTATYSLAPRGRTRRPVRLLLTSDHQLKTMTPANLEKVAATVGTELDGVLVAGDLVNVPDRASEWFDSTTGLAFFAGLSGRAGVEIAGRTYRGAPIAPSTPIYPCIGNHEVMGRWSESASLGDQFNDPQPRRVAERRWARGEAPEGYARADWVRDNSWDTTTYEEVFPYPRSPQGGPRWWSRTIGDVHVVALFVTQIWRGKGATGRGAFQEDAAALDDPTRWGYGQHVFEPVQEGSAQYRWLQRELRSPAARRARYRIVMYHHPAHGLGDNSAPPFTDPVQTVERDPLTGAVTAVRYAYPKEQDHILRDLEPLFDDARVHLVHNGHSHLWNRFRSAAGTNWLETSNVGNSYGAYDGTSGASRALPPSPDHVLQGDPGGLEPVVPTVAPLTAADGSPLPYVASNDVTCFSVLDSADGVVRSWRFDTREPGSDVVLFDEMPLA
ncbi:metallophosphoesterase [Vallicoccus soli]|uniref:Metallophosphoesterase n=2 Tax=Vallicoccus soli TaxID=2339232 RepID=A0A3A3YY00_9ACTN|nr:metallophosphoesterase [Vallicoccus soli]